jgi:hypothetical protein
MWNNEEEFNENGEPVKLYVPGPTRRKDLAAADSHIGGLASVEGDAPPCAKCQGSMFLLVQLLFKRVSKSDGSFVDRTVCVFGCPRASCFRSVSFDHGFCSGESGVMCCQSIETPSAVLGKTAVAAVPLTKSSWYTSENDEDGADNDWGVSAGGTDELSKLENAVAAMEANLEGGSLIKAKPQKPAKTETAKQDADSPEAFDCYPLKMEREPIPARQVVEADDVGLSASDDKIRNMLARYMEEEDDETILAALRGTDMGGGTEQDERLTEEDRTLLGFQDRIKRKQRQVIRYAPSGVPLFSIPSSDAKTGDSLWKKPNCACGAKCVFEFQLLPQLLLFLKVDKFAGNTSDNGGIGGMLSSGMNWGSIAVFSCPNKCGHSDCAMVIQKSVDQDMSLGQGQNDQEEDTMMDGPVAVVEDLDDDDEFEPDA